MVIDTNSLAMATIGGVLIGVASLVMLAFNGRIAGISGILGGVLRPPVGGAWQEHSWRMGFLLAMVLTGAALVFAMPSAFPESMPRSTAQIAAAGVLVGVGTRLGSGCTSGHGVCGIGRFSMRSILATCTFMATGAATVAIVRVLGGGQ